MTVPAPQSPKIHGIPAPTQRRLRVYALDPSLSTSLETAGIHVTALPVRWEKLLPGPVGEYIEVVDHDPVSGLLYEPVDLDHPNILAQEGLAPSESVPQSHQQMVYAVAMTTIQNFEKALGRKALWAPGPDFSYVSRLRLYPHALRGSNAFYSREKQAILFGYFKTPRGDTLHAPGSTVFTCLSQDIIAHETTHALLDGMHRRYIEPVNPDCLAFHEAFADIVALFQHFSFPKMLRHQIAKTRGDLGAPSLLVELAQEFGHAVGCRGALRSALGAKPDPNLLSRTEEPHDRGAVLVSAIFDAFTKVFRRRASELMRLASSGTGVLPEGALPDLLVEELSKEASKTASQFVAMCIRALDYTPVSGLSFGEYLRALITADRDFVPDDTLCYRVSLIESFRQRGIYVAGVPSLTEEALEWPSGEELEDYESSWLADLLRKQSGWLRYEGDRCDIHEKTKLMAANLHEYLLQQPEDELHRFGRLCGLALDPATAPQEIETDKNGVPKFEVHQIRTAFRARPDGTLLNHVILTLTQRKRLKMPGLSRPFDFRGGATLILDLDKLRLRHCIRSPIWDERRQAYQEAYYLQNQQRTNGRGDDHA